ncbi:MAG: methyltransferase, partial [Bacteroidales bacterium]|nr:methyltransferase [Bacteroidales bacterium]
MKVGTDGVLLGVLTDIEHSKNILDVGCGCGLISLMLAQRSRALIDAIDIEESAVLEARFNVECSPWPNRIQVYHSSFQDYCTDSRISHYDLIVSNPPFFIDSLKNPHPKKSLARHSD